MLSFSRVFRAFLAAWIVSAELLSLSSAEKPTLEHLNPAGGGKGTTNLVTLSGKFEPWPPSFWVEGTGVTFKPTTNKAKVEIEISPEAAPGPRLVRAYNSEGASEPRLFIVGEGREIRDQEPNNHFEEPQTLSELPITVNGYLERKGDVDCYRIDLSAGEWLDARIESYLLMSKVDAVLRLVTPEGYQLAWNHDSGTLDPRIVWRAPANGSYVLQVFGFVYPANAEVQLTGGEGAIYRLHVSRNPHSPAEFSDPLQEQEPNNSPAVANPIPLGKGITAAVAHPDDEDRFVFQAEKGESFLIQVRSSSLGFPLDAWLRLEDESGKELARSDDADNTFDPRLEWKAENPGKYILAVGSLTHRGGDDYRYELRAEKLQPDFAVTVSDSAWHLPPGGTAEIKAKVARQRGFTNELALLFRGLPPGVSGSTTNLLDKTGEVILKISAETNATPFNAPFELLALDTVAKTARSVPIIFTERTVNNGVPGGYTRLLVEQSDQLWLTVRPNPPPVEEKK